MAQSGWAARAAVGATRRGPHPPGGHVWVLDGRPTGRTTPGPGVSRLEYLTRESEREPGMRKGPGWFVNRSHKDNAE